jgi:hypothetical protein
LEKAYAKAHGSYANILSKFILTPDGTPAEVFKAFTFATS